MPWVKYIEKNKKKSLFNNILKHRLKQTANANIGASWSANKFNSKMIVDNNILWLQLCPVIFQHNDDNDLTTTKHWVRHLDHTQKDDEA